jgi:hypothetical protein
MLGPIDREQGSYLEIADAIRRYGASASSDLHTLAKDRFQCAHLEYGRSFPQSRISILGQQRPDALSRLRFESGAS